MQIAITTWNAEGLGISGNSKLTQNYDNTWEILIDHYTARLRETDGFREGKYLLMGMLAEAGTPPDPPQAADVASGSLIKATVKKTNYDYNYCWYGWSKGTTNLRCSLASMQLYPKPPDSWLSSYPMARFNTPHSLAEVTGKNLDTRPAALSEFYSLARLFSLNVLLVHLPSGKKVRNLNISILKDLMQKQHGFFGVVPSVILGDINIHIKGQTNDQIKTELGIGPGSHWDVVRTNYPTQRSEGELDWALCYKCKGQAKILGPVTPSVEAGSGKGFGVVAQGISDHAVINYLITF